jgi:hypothetical protein
MYSASDDDHGQQTLGIAFDARAFAAGSMSNAGIIPINYPTYAKGGPGGGGGGGGGGGSSFTWTSGTSTTTDNSAEYNFQITFKGTWSLGQITDVQTAANLISEWITYDIQDVFFRGKVIDDLALTIEISPIDGEGGILGQAGPTAVRTGASYDPYLPAAGVIKFDSADIADFADVFFDITLHEMLHTVGFGTVWSYFDGLVVDDMFMGDDATAVYGSPIPIEQDGGSGTAGSHWDEETFQDELMTGYIGYWDAETETYDSTNELSYMTIASLGDLGYDVIGPTTYSDPFALTV